MHFDDRFILMKNDLCKAATTIHKLKKERDEYRISYEILKEDSVSRKEIMKNAEYLEELKEANDCMQRELLRFKQLLLEKDRTIAHMEKHIQNSNKKVKDQMDTFRELESARKELKNELTLTNISKENHTMYTEIISMVQTLILSLKRNPPIYKIFKHRIQCKKRFITLVEQENYSLGFRYLVKFILDLIDSFQFCEDYDYDTQIFNSGIDDARFTTTEGSYHSKSGYYDNKDDDDDDDTDIIKQSLIKQSIRLEKLNKEMKNFSKDAGKLDTDRIATERGGERINENNKEQDKGKNKETERKKNIENGRNAKNDYINNSKISQNSYLMKKNISLSKQS